MKAKNELIENFVRKLLNERVRRTWGNPDACPHYELDFDDLTSSWMDEEVKEDLMPILEFLESCDNENADRATLEEFKKGYIGL